MFNASTIINESASGEQLRRLWQNLKTRQRDALTRERQHRMATGGGSSCPDADINPDIAEISPALFVEIQDTLDSDHIDLQTVQHVDSLIESTLSHAVDSPTGESQNLENLTTQPNTIPHSSIQSVESELSTNEKKLRVQILKAEHLNREKRAAELHELQVKFIQEKHKLEIDILKQQLREAEAKAELAKQNHR
ncbi:uncharacterized protein LOC124643776 [Helicoverpa zea]|uniref:uncharacterized protein LOC124633020 n=1 Tax=Helicoverpa zea TaxID=7113 RepID=UPI000B38E72E|nr:uncharacterized protein LOC124633020 [Helicoverpa zea]XP_047036446.1 uncharacterized protein LOC124642176 [Helicoverpa zea]XP_047038812.1 uncharacterized protein LOC124643776 [Helicoverpa zea]